MLIPPPLNGPNHSALQHAPSVDVSHFDEAEKRMENSSNPYMRLYANERRQAHNRSPPSPQVMAAIWEVAQQTAGGMEYLHQRGMVHRDLKPDNLLMMMDGTASLLANSFSLVFFLFSFSSFLFPLLLFLPPFLVPFCYRFCSKSLILRAMRYPIGENLRFWSLTCVQFA